MFKGRIISRSNINGKVHTFQKDFDDYDTYNQFLDQNPEYASPRFFDTIWNPWSIWSENPLPQLFGTTHSPSLPVQHLPEGVDLSKYEKRLQDKKIQEHEKQQKKSSLEKTEQWLQNYLEQNPDDTEAHDDLQKVKKELEMLV